MRVFTIGFTKKSAEAFFSILKESGVRTVVDIRLKNNSQLAAFAKGEDFAYFLKEIAGIRYVHDTQLAPTEDLLGRYRRGETSWEEYEREFAEIMKERGIEECIRRKYADMDGICLLCSEPTPERCHRRLVADIFRKIFAADVIHL